MPVRVPMSSDFPGMELEVIQPPQGQSALNVLILLHGLGDSNTSFAQLARNLNLPYTACIALRAPTPLPFDLGGFHWGDDILFDQASGQMETDTGFSKSGSILQHDMIKNGLIDKCGFKARDIMLFGFGQGGMAALATAAALGSELGGVISIGGALPSGSNTVSEAGKSMTPVLLCHGSSRSSIMNNSMTRTKAVFQTVQDVEWRRSGDSMPQNSQEMMPVMRFFASRVCACILNDYLRLDLQTQTGRNARETMDLYADRFQLRSRAGVPPDATEVN